MSEITPFGWKENEPPDITAVNLEKDRNEIGKYAKEQAESSQAILEALGNVNGVVALKFKKATTFTATLTGATTFKPEEFPSLREVGTLWVTQDATGGRTWSIEGITWIGSEPIFATTKNLTYVISFFVLESKLYGIAGLEGPEGKAGNTIRSGEGAPAEATGVSGDYYINTAAHTIYGPKIGTVWGSATSLIGPEGKEGPAGGAGGILSGYFGDGSDGTVTMDGTNTFAFATKSGNEYTLTRDIYPTTLTITGIATLKRAQFKVFCSVEYKCEAGGKDIQPFSNGGASTTTAAGAASGHQSNGTLAAGAEGGSGAAAGGAAAKAGTQFVTQGPTLGGAGGAGGNGTAQNGAAGGATIVTGSEGYPSRASINFLTGFAWTPTGTRYLNGGTGGGGGGADAATQGGGGGGEGGGVHLTIASIFNNAGTIECNGGAGGKANTAGAGGGGGGGGGGFVGVVCHTLTAEGTIKVEGGAGGAGSNAAGTQGAEGHKVILKV